MKTLSLNANELTESGTKHLSNVIKNLSKLTTVEIKNNLFVLAEPIIGLQNEIIRNYYDYLDPEEACLTTVVWKPDYK